MSTSTPDPVIHHPERLRIAATLVALPQGDGLTVTRLQGMLGLTPARLSARLREPDQAGYIRTRKTGDGGTQAAVALTGPRNSPPQLGPAETTGPMSYPCEKLGG